MLEIDRLAPLIEEIKSLYGIRFILSPRIKLPTASSIKAKGNKKFLVVYKPDTDCTDQIAQDILRTTRQYDEEWKGFDLITLGGADQRTLSFIKRLKTLITDVWVKKEMIEHGFSFGKDVGEYLEIAYGHLSAGQRPYSHIVNENIRLSNSMVDYTYYLLAKNERDDVFNKAFEKIYASVDPGAVKLADQAFKLISKDNCLIPNQARAALIQLLEHLNMKDIAVKLTECSGKT